MLPPGNPPAKPYHVLMPDVALLDRPLLERVAACRVCAAALPLGPRPVVRASDPAARILIVGQAVGRRVR